MNLLIFGSGDIATKGIVPVVGGTTLDKGLCDVRMFPQVHNQMAMHKPEVVINCAGVSHPTPVKDALDFDDELDTNLKGSFHVAQAATRMHVRTMIFIASVAGLYGKPGHAAYSASKAGVISLVQSLAFEGYDAYAISPGRVDTIMRERDYEDEDPRTRLEPVEIGYVVKDILAGKYEPGDNIIVRRIGYETVPIKVSKGEPWRSELKIGQPKTL